MSDPYLVRRYGRRAFLVRAGGTLAATGGLGSLIAACGGSDGGDEVAAEDPDYGTSKRPLGFHHDAAVGPLFAPFIEYFNKNYAPLQVKTSYVSQDYFAVTAQQLAGGSVDYDILFADEGYLDDWYENGWIRAIDEFDGVPDLLSNLAPGVEDEIRASDGKLAALPYFRGAELFVYNQQHLEEIGSKPPESWDQFMEIARELKSKGVAQTPYSPYWINYAFLIWHQLAAEAAADGAEPFFGDNSEPNFASDPAVERTLQRWQELYRDGLVPKDVFTTDYGGVTNIFGGGKSSMSLRYQAQVVGWRDPKQSRVADAVRNGIIPGSTRTTHSFGAYWFMSESTGAPSKSWTLMEYLGGAGKDDSYHVPKELVAKGLGLSSGYASIDSAPDVQKSWGKWADVDLLTEQLENSVSLGPTVNKTWYPKFLDQVCVVLQDTVAGKKSISDGLSEAAEIVNSES
jgi:ABC-type glycerol-3-phosphate transport system substrate-binding protein